VFRDRVKREIRDGLQAALGDMAVVEVVDKHPKLAEVLEKGLRSLDGWTDRAAVKTHFVLIDFTGVDYEIQARQYDGQTSMTTPVVRRESTDDREFVARTAVLMIERDFGIVGTFSTWPKGKKPQKVQLELKGGGLDTAISRWVQQGDVFAVVAVPTGNGFGRVVADAIVQIETPPGEGGGATCEGNLFWRREPPSGSGIAGYRCVKLGATKGPLQLRLVQVKPDGSPGEMLAVPTLLVRRHGFTGEDDTRLEVRSFDKVHSYDTKKLGDKGRYDRVAFVSVKDGNAIRAEIPIVILDDRQIVVPVTLLDNDTISVDFRKRAWKLSVIESYAVQATIFTELQELSGKKDTPRADLIAKAKEGAHRSADDLARLRDERKEAYDGALSDADRRDLAQADQRLDAIRKGAEELRQYAERQENIDKVENDPKKRDWQEQIERGKLLERDGELGKALIVYDDLIINQGLKDAKLQDHVKDLRERWKTKGEDHKQARKFIYEVFPTLDTAALQTQVDEARKALEVCEKAEDYVAPLKLYKGMQIHAGRLLKEADALQDKVGEEDVKQLKMIREIGANLTKLEGEIKAYMEKAPKPAEK
jgi:hypothetical protein